MACLVLYAVGLDDRRQGGGHTSQHRLVTVFLALLDLFPVVQHLRHVVHLAELAFILGLAVGQRAWTLGTHLRGMIDVRVAEYQLVNQRVAHVGYVELCILFADACVERNVQQHVAQLLADVVRIALDQRVAQLIGFFYRVGAQAFVGLLSVPGAFFAQRVQHVEHTPKGLHLLFSCVSLFHNKCKSTNNFRICKVLYGKIFILL